MRAASASPNGCARTLPVTAGRSAAARFAGGSYKRRAGARRPAVPAAPPAGGWTCVPPANPPAAGRYYYLTRLATPATVEVEHRWYRGDRLVQSVPLTIRASSGSGFRTYSRQTVPEAQPGEWRVEVRSQQGAVLAEERFTVQ